MSIRKNGLLNILYSCWFLSLELSLNFTPYINLPSYPLPWKSKLHLKYAQVVLHILWTKKLKSPKLLLLLLKAAFPSQLLRTNLCICWLPFFPLTHMWSFSKSCQPYLKTVFEMWLYTAFINTSLIQAIITFSHNYGGNRFIRRHPCIYYSSQKQMTVKLRADPVTSLFKTFQWLILEPFMCREIFY